MTRWYVFLRAINVGDRRMTNDDLLRPFRELDPDARAYQAAGNVTFRTGDDGAAIEARLADALPAAFGIDVVAFVRSSSELGAIVARRPFDATDLARTAGRVQVALLSEIPDDGSLREVTNMVPSDDRVVIGSGREMFWLPTEGVSTSKLPVGAIERVVGPMTIRTMTTLERMLARFGG